MKSKIAMSLGLAVMLALAMVAAMLAFNSSTVSADVNPAAGVAISGNSGSVPVLKMGLSDHGGEFNTNTVFTGAITGSSTAWHEPPVFTEVIAAKPVDNGPSTNTITTTTFTEATITIGSSTGPPVFMEVPAAKPVNNGPSINTITTTTFTGAITDLPTASNGPPVFMEVTLMLVDNDPTTLRISITLTDAKTLEVMAVGPTFTIGSDTRLKLSVGSGVSAVMATDGMEDPVQVAFNRLKPLERSSNNSTLTTVGLEVVNRLHLVLAGPNWQ